MKRQTENPIKGFARSPQRTQSKKSLIFFVPPCLCARYIYFLFFTSILLSVLLFSSTSQAATLEEINIQTSDQSTQIDLLLDEKVRFDEHRLAAKGQYQARCYIDLYGTQINPSLQSWLTVPGDHVDKIRTGLHATKLRIVFDLKHQQECSISTLENPFGIQVRFSSPTPQAAEVQPVPGPKSELKSEEAAAHPTTEDVQKKVTEVPAFQPQPTTVETEEPEFFFGESEEATNKTPDIWGWAQFFAAHDTDEDDAEDHHFYRVRGRLGSDWERSLSYEKSLQIKASIDIDRIFYNSELAEEETEFNLHEGYLQLNGNNWDISFGKQRVRWGKSDQLSPVDSINPQDYRQSLAVDLEDRAIPSWMLRSRWFGSSFSIETVVQPWFEKSEMEFFDSDWALYRNLRQVITENPTVPLALSTYASTLSVNEDKPTKNLENSSVGIRFATQTDSTDFAISYHYGWETLPTIKSFPVDGINYNGNPNSDPADILATISWPPTSSKVDATYKRQHTVGFEWETSLLDPLGFRGEIAHIDKVAFLTSSLDSKRKQVTHLVTGIDYTSESEWYFNIQGSWQYIHNFENDILYFEENTVALLGEIRKPVWRGNLELATKYNYIVTDGSSYLQPSATLKYFQNVECEVGAMIYNGDGKTLLGSYDQADQVYAKMKISF